jgi:uncharacterized protein YlxP (DUF503 family)
MQVALLTLDFHLEGCRSLTEKRRRLGGLKDRFGRLSNVATCESAYPDQWGKAQWCFVCVGPNKAAVQSTCALIQEHASQLDAVLYQQQLEYL